MAWILVSVIGLAVASQLAPAFGQRSTFTAVDVGRPAESGATREEGDSFTVIGGGSDIWDLSDQFHFAYQEQTGDFDVQVRVHSLQPIHPLSKAGLMARETLEPSSRMVFERITPEAVVTSNGERGANNVRFAYRTGNRELDPDGSVHNGGRNEEGSGTPAYPNAWLRLRRLGNVLIGYSSSDGVDWFEQGREDTESWEGGALARTLLVGLAVTSHDNSRGQTAQAEFRELRLTDRTAPTLNCPSNLMAECRSPEGTPVSFAIAAVDDRDTNVTVSCEPPSGASFPLGATTVNCRAADSSGNFSQCSFTVTIIDRAAPAIRCPDDMVAECREPSGTAVTFSLSVSDNCDTNVTVTCRPPSGAAFPLGAAEVFCEAVDSSGNSSQCTFTIAVVDRTAPAITCPTNILVQAENEQRAVITWRVLAADTCGGHVVVGCVPSSGSVFPVGTTTVGCTAEDESGNSTDCSFTVTVLPPPPLEIRALSQSNAVLLRWTGARILQETEFITSATSWRDSGRPVVLERDVMQVTVPVEGASSFFRLRPINPVKRALLPWASHSARKRPITVRDLEFSFQNRINLKFNLGTGIRSRNGLLVLDPAVVTGAPPEAELERVNRLFNALPRHAATRMHFLPEATLAALKQSGEASSGEQLPDLNLWFYVYVEVPDDEAMVRLVNELNQNPIVELAYASYLPVFPGLDGVAARQFHEFLQANRTLRFPTPDELQTREIGWLPPSQGAWARPMGGRPPAISVSPSPAPSPGGPQPSVPPDFEPLQHYLSHVSYLRQNFWSAWGNNAAYTDVEYAWNHAHIDLPDIADFDSIMVNGPTDPALNTLGARNHGTAVIGEISSDPDDGFGTTGLAPDADVRLSTEWPVGSAAGDRPGAISAAAAQFDRGAAILLEMQMYAGFDANNNGTVGAPPSTDDDLVPCEWDPAVRDAIKTATGNGRIVIEAAGNGDVSLDHPGFQGGFSPPNISDPNDPINGVDSAAIIVGANGFSIPIDYKACFSTYGARVNVFAEGDFQIVTTGYGDHHTGNGENEFYTDQFAGTSGASPIVTGSVLALAGILRSYHGSVFAPKEIRRLLNAPKLLTIPKPTPAGLLECQRRVANPYRTHSLTVSAAIEAIQNRHLQMQSTDFDGDGRADYATWYPSLFTGEDGVWEIHFSSDGSSHTYEWGERGDIPCPANMVGDGRAELVVFRPADGTWYIHNLETGTGSSVQFGEIGDIPVPLDFEGDGYANLAVFRSVNSAGTPQWLIATASQGMKIVNHGLPGDTPLARDFDGDGKDDLAVFYAGQWSIAQSKFNYVLGFYGFQLGGDGDIPLAYKSAGKWYIAVWQPSTGTLLQKTGINANSPVTEVQYGVPGDIPRFADTDSDGSDEFIISRGVVWFNYQYGLIKFTSPQQIGRGGFAAYGLVR